LFLEAAVVDPQAGNPQLLGCPAAGFASVEPLDAPDLVSKAVWVFGYDLPPVEVFVAEATATPVLGGPTQVIQLPALAAVPALRLPK